MLELMTQWVQMGPIADPEDSRPTKLSVTAFSTEERLIIIDHVHEGYKSVRGPPQFVNRAP